MNRYTIVALFCLVYVSTINTQTMDLSFCDPNKLPAVNPPLPFFVPSLVAQYEMNMEINDGLTRRTFEMDEWFDGLENRAITITRAAGIEIKQINNDNTNEILTLTGDLCIATKANETDSAVQSVVINGTEHIISGLLFLHVLNPNSNEVYIGKSTVRGIPVNQWQFCAYEPRRQITSKITYSISDPTQWSIAVPVGNLTAIPVEIQIENKFNANSTTWTDLVEITKYRPGILTRDEFWVPPQGVMCKNRQPGKPTPLVPKAFKFSSTFVGPMYGYDELIGQIANTKQEYDYDNKLYRLEYSYKNNPIIEIHDFNNGLRYIIDKFRGNCTLTVIGPDEPDATMIGPTIHMKNPLDFFDFEKVEYQYVGQKHINHINTDVWIGETILANMTVYKEWHFMADGWVQQSDLVVEVREPVLLIITFFRPTQNNDYVKIPVYYYINDFDESGLNLWDFDLAACVDNYPKRHFMFNLPTQYREPMESNKGLLWLGILVGLESSLAVSRLRISRLNVDFDVDKIFVTFTILEKPPTVNASLEATLDQAVQLLNATIEAGKLLIPFQVDSTTVVDIQALPGSLKEFDRGTGSIVYVNTTVYVIKPEYINVTQYINRTEYVNNTVYVKEKTSGGYSGGIAAAIAIVMLFVGSGVGLLLIIAFKSNYFRKLKPKSFS